MTSSATIIPSEALVDNTTIERNGSNQLQIKDGGVSETKLNTSTITAFSKPYSVNHTDATGGSNSSTSFVVVSSKAITLNNQNAFCFYVKGSFDFKSSNGEACTTKIEVTDGTNTISRSFTVTGTTPVTQSFDFFNMVVSGTNVITGLKGDCTLNISARWNGTGATATNTTNNINIDVFFLNETN